MILVNQQHYYPACRQAGMILHCVTLFIFLFAVQHVIEAQKNYRIVYNVLEDKATDNYEIYSMNMDGTDKKNISNTPAVEWAYHAYKDKVYYVSDIDTCHRCYFLYEMDAHGNGKRKVSELQLEDSWMGTRNNGKEMIVTGRVGKVRQQLFIINIKNGSFKQITDDTLSYKTDPIFISGGNEIVLRYRPDKKLRQTVADELWSIRFNKTNVDGISSNVLKYQITHFPKSDTTTKWYEYHAGPPQYNMKYGFISYLSKQNNQTQIYTVVPDLKKRFQSIVTVQITSGKMNSGWHSWSSDGKWLAMDKSTPDEKSYDIYLMNYKTKETIQLTNDPKYEQAPVFVEVKK